MKELFKQIKELKALAERRAYQKLTTLYPKLYVRKDADHWEFFEDDDGETLTVSFMEDINYDRPDCYSQELSWQELDMTEDQWDKYIQDIILQKEQQAKEAKQKALTLKKLEEDRLKENRRLKYEELKKEFDGK